MTATLTPVVLDLGIREYLPDDADLPTGARKAVQAWAKAQADLQQAEQGGARANVQVTSAGIVVQDFRGRPTRGVDELLAPLRGIVGTR